MVIQIFVFLYFITKNIEKISCWEFFHISIVFFDLLVIVTSRGASYNEAWGCCLLSGQGMGIPKGG